MMVADTVEFTRTAPLAAVVESIPTLSVYVT